MTQDPAFALRRAALSLCVRLAISNLIPQACGRGSRVPLPARARNKTRIFRRDTLHLLSCCRDVEEFPAPGDDRRIQTLALQSNMPHAFNRLGTILAHIGLINRAGEVYERGRPFHMGSREYDLARKEIRAWHAEIHATNSYFASQPAMKTGTSVEGARSFPERAFAEA
jgi:hypothetical protein